MVKALLENEFENEIANGITVVDFFATWCGPCKMLSPVLDDLSEELDGKVKFLKSDVDVNQDLASKFNIMSVPSVLVFKDGQKVKTMVGYKPKEEILAELEKVMG